MDGGEKELTHLVVEQETQELELFVGIDKTVDVGKEEYLSVNLSGKWTLVQYHSTFLSEIVVCPDVMIAGEVVYLHPQV